MTDRARAKVRGTVDAENLREALEAIFGICDKFFGERARYTITEFSALPRYTSVGTQTPGLWDIDFEAREN